MFPRPVTIVLPVVFSWSCCAVTGSRACSLQKTLTGMMMLLLSAIANVLLRGLGRVAVTSGDWKFLFTTWQGIRGMQIRIIDYLRDMFALQKDKKKAEDDLRYKDEQIDRLSVESYTDALTGVGNKAAYIRKVDELTHQTNESDTEFAIVMADINRLKSINDEYGHKSGDLYIKGCCHMLCEAFKHSPVFRIGGDEFAAILTGADYADRKAILEQLRSDYEASYEQEEASPWLRYSAAVGMAENSSDDNTAEFVFRRADEAMYKDKERFRQKYGKDSR